MNRVTVSILFRAAVAILGGVSLDAAVVRAGSSSAPDRLALWYRSPAQHLDCDNKNITLLASTAVSGKALDLWKGPIYFMPYYSVPVDLRRKIRVRLGKSIAGGGNSMTQAFWLASVVFRSKTVMFVANEYCFDSVKNYYADKKAAKQEVLRTLYPAVDVLGRQRWTLAAHYNYVIWQEKACADLCPPGFFIDTSFGLLGKDGPQIRVMELSEAIKMIKMAFKNRDRLNSAKSESERLKIIKELKPKDEPSQVYRYNLSEHRDNYCSLQEVELVWAAAIDLGANVPPRVFLRCTDLSLPEKPKNE